MIIGYCQFWFNSTSLPKLLQVTPGLLKQILWNLWSRLETPCCKATNSIKALTLWLSTDSTFVVKSIYEISQWKGKQVNTVIQCCTLMRLSTANLTAWTGRARSGIAFPSSASSCRMTSFDTWRSHKHGQQHHIQHQTPIHSRPFKQLSTRTDYCNINRQGNLGQPNMLVFSCTLILYICVLFFYNLDEDHFVYCGVGPSVFVFTQFLWVWFSAPVQMNARRLVSKTTSTRHVRH